MSGIKELEDDLKVSEGRYRQMFDSMTEMFQVIELIYDDEGKPIDYYYVDVNPAFERLVNKSRLEIIGNRAKDLFGIVEDHWVQTYNRVATSGLSESFDNYGAELNKYYEIFAWKISEKKVAIIFSDITERKQKEKELNLHYEENKKLSAELLISNKLTSEELIIANKELLFQNKEKEKRAAELIIANKELVFQNKEKENRANELIIANKELAFQNKEKEKRAAELLIANIELAYQNELKEKRAAELIIANKELAFQNKEKKKRAAELVIANKELAYQNKEKEKRAAELLIANIELAYQNEEKEKRASELIIANKELLQLLHINADKDKFINIIAHDLRSPFNSILGFLNLLSNNIRKYEIDKIEIQLNLINNSVNNFYTLLEDLLMWVTVSSGKIPYEPKKLSFESICDDVIANLRLTAAAKNIIINKIALDNINIFVDKNMLNTILRNLVSNAIKYTNKNGRIYIYADQNTTSVTITISDTGIGLTPERINNLFDISQNISTKGTANEKGTGFGLLLCKEFVEKHSGTIWVESELGKGCDFKFTIPLQND